MVDVADRAVDVASVAGSVAHVDLSVWGLIGQADIVVKIIMLALILSSMWSWAIIFDKWTYFKDMRDKMSKFEKTYRSSRVLGALFERINRKNPGNPMAAMFVVGMSELKSEEGVDRYSINNMQFLKERVYNSVQRAKNEAMDKMESNLIFLATIGSAGPFIGLFGTVWGIVNSFQAIAATKNTTLAVVAPGIAEALLATAIGLFAAIPAVVFYNMFSNEIRRLSGKLEDYASELSSNISNYTE